MDVIMFATACVVFRCSSVAVAGAAALFSSDV